MNAIETLLDDYGRLLDELPTEQLNWSPAPLTPVNLEHQAQSLDHQGLGPVLEELARARGWLLLPNQVLILPAPLDGLRQPPLHGEARVDEASLRLNHRGGDNWTLHRFHLRPCTAQQATHLAQAVRHLPDLRAPGPLRYQRLWRVEAGQAPWVKLAVFDGFEESQV